MNAASYELKLCRNCAALAGAGPGIACHSGLGRPKAEVGYDLYRCAVCHARWSLSRSGWAAEAP